MVPATITYTACDETCARTHSEARTGIVWPPSLWPRLAVQTRPYSCAVLPKDKCTAGKLCCLAVQYMRPLRPAKPIRRQQWLAAHPDGDEPG
jgi:hypothetical protein